MQNNIAIFVEAYESVGSFFIVVRGVLLILRLYSQMPAAIVRATMVTDKNASMVMINLFGSTKVMEEEACRYIDKSMYATKTELAKFAPNKNIHVFFIQVISFLTCSELATKWFFVCKKATTR
jgi:hypothetical protein